MRALLFASLAALAFTVGSAARSDTKTSAKAGAAPKTVKAPALKKPTAAEKVCKKSELRVQPICKKGVACPALCLPTPSKHSGLCPDGQRWEKLACPANARCLLGGRCVAKGKAVGAAVGAPSKTVVGKLATASAALVKCGIGRVPSAVKCLRSDPCPVLCLPARLDPSLKESPKVKPL